MTMPVRMPISLQKNMVIHLFIHLTIWMLLPVSATIAMEIIQELPTVDYILVPIGGGGLITGVATLAKMLNPKIRVIGVEPREAASMTAALKAEKWWNFQVPTRLQMVQQ